VHVVRLRIPALNVDTAVERLRVGLAGRLRPPQDPARPGWFPESPVPGDLGAAVVAGHRDSRTGPAVFWRLADLSVGDSVVVDRSDGRTARFRVVDVRQVSRSRFPTADVYGPMPDHALRLITCGGLYDHVYGRYRDNVLVLALAV
jgi:LPXTG-site transpeptidase (sortase) family protein